MEYIAGSILLTKVGRDVDAKSLEMLFRSIDAPIESETLDLFLSKVSGKSMDELMASGSELMKSFAVSSAPASAKAEEKKDAPAAAATQEQDDDADFDIFGAF
ncbi:acidic ribosomal protein P2 [Ordospora colligata]|uniref:Acidic ribosomal protein P2 n=1 Tax=Ordospora colligata OC4 TaxID=1354746 RepID=A0A0B2UJS3_9MICR|nr:acidic ribosomal protein P2 [Ordospora colligata OC4]KHN69272.1 acidic ribosomal protein P2 [Ordospora colligata OC4]TBU15088.1 acidic ribosomal protein P2 [Ordospora colligata]TBU15139.1 acidic ribosomal protein P2 [Ordospora colligata]TBU18385.1 acidic ribosomal protein P2 [Ordospora colligata]